MAKTFEFEMGTRVQLVDSGESGKVIGRAEYEQGENNYYVRYVDSMGGQREAWWGESAIAAGEALPNL